MNTNFTSDSCYDINAPYTGDAALAVNTYCLHWVLVDLFSTDELASSPDFPGEDAGNKCRCQNLCSYNCSNNIQF